MNEKMYPVVQHDSTMFYLLYLNDRSLNKGQITVLNIELVCQRVILVVEDTPILRIESQLTEATYLQGTCIFSYANLPFTFFRTFDQRVAALPDPPLSELAVITRVSRL